MLNVCAQYICAQYEQMHLFLKIKFPKKKWQKKKPSLKIPKIMIIYAVLNGQWFNMYLKKAEQDRTFYTRNRLLTV